MTQKELAEAINEDKIVYYEGSKYKCVGYKLIKRNGSKEYYAGILDMENKRTILWVGLNDLKEGELLG